MKISKHLDLSEVVRSESAKRAGVSNMPTDQHLENFKVLAEKVFEPIREHFGVPIHISSGYRSKELNAITKGASKTSDHCFGFAIDIDMDGSSSGVTNNDVFHFIRKYLKFKQLIAEFPINGKLSWVHVSYDPNNLKNEILIATKKAYIPYKGNEKSVL